MRTFRIYEENMSKFEEKMKKLQKKCKKIGNGNVSYKVVGEEFETSKEGIIYKILDVVIESAELPIIAGWEFVSAINHYNSAGNILNIIPTFEGEIPEKYRTVKQGCDHCNSKRTRKDTYILFNAETNDFKQVGKSCLKDFLGHANPENYASYCELLIEIDTEDWSDLGGNGLRQKYTTVVNWVSQTIAQINNDGVFVSKKASNENGGEPTSERVFEQISGTAKHIIKPTEEDKILAEKIIEYTKGFEAKSEYEQNLKVIVSGVNMRFEVRGLLTSIVTFYQKTQQYLRTKELEKEETLQSEFQGEVGQRIDLDLIVKKVVVWENIYGTTKMHIFKDLKGNIFTWKASSEHLEEGVAYKIKGTIKAHEIYNEISQTAITRCKVIE